MQQNTSGILIIDKPPISVRPGSWHASKKQPGPVKPAMPGTLDPFATGVMVCCINQATRLARFFLHSGKTYRATIRLGMTTDTQDFTGNVLTRCETTVFPDQLLQSIFKAFEGHSQQQPPAFFGIKTQRGTALQTGSKRDTGAETARPINISQIENNQDRSAGNLF